MPNLVYILNEIVKFFFKFFIKLYKIKPLGGEMPAESGGNDRNFLGGFLPKTHPISNSICVLNSFKQPPLIRYIHLIYPIHRPYTSHQRY